jgi:hypothetical protein
MWWQRDRLGYGKNIIINCKLICPFKKVSAYHTINTLAVTLWTDAKKKRLATLAVSKRRKTWLETWWQREQIGYGKIL